MYQAPLQNCWDVGGQPGPPSMELHDPVRKSNDQPGHSEKCHGERIMLRGGTMVGRKLYSIDGERFSLRSNIYALK